MQAWRFKYLMKVIKTDINSINQNERETCVTIGMFDALHKYHKMIIEKTQTIAQENNLESIIVTFDHKPTKETETLLNENKKINYINENFQIDKMIILQVNNDLINTSKEQFVKILKNKLRVTKLVEGSDFRFGFEKGGDIEYLKYNFGEKNVFIYKRDENISTSKIKKLVKENKIAEIDDELEVNINLL
ncbi:FAD synthetase [Mesoplasma florum]|uniref:FAD synthase n=2 Tax=Entomoplasmataceae TaxID=33925 RepID=A0A2R3P776_MESFO|nr:FAD synthetase [Mesoplasma florum]